MEALASRMSIHVEREVARSLIQDLGWSRNEFHWNTNMEKFLLLQKLIIEKQCNVEKSNTGKGKLSQSVVLVLGTITTSLY